MSDSFKGALSADESRDLLIQQIRQWRQEIHDAKQRTQDNLRELDQYVEQNRRDIINEYHYETDPIQKQIDSATRLLVDHEMLKGPKPIIVSKT